MEIRNALKKIDNYLSVVQNLNRTILEEGTMAPDELKLMKKYLRGCIERIEDIEAKLNIADEPETPAFTEPESPVPVAAPVVETEIVTEFVPAAETRESAPVAEPVTVTVAEQIIIDPEQSRTVSQLVAEVSAEAEQAPVISFEEPVVESSTIVETVVAEQVSAFRLVAEEESEVPVIAAEEKRSWADLWEENSTPVNNGLVAEPEPELNLPAAESVVQVVTETVVTQAVAEEPVHTLVAEDEPETEVVSTIVEVRSETTLNDVMQTRKETGLFEMFNQTQAEPQAAPSSNYTASNAGGSVLTAVETDVLVAEIDTPQPEFSLSNIFDQIRTPSEERTRSAKTLSESIALNDKFIFVRELFGNQFNEYEHALRQLDNLGSFAEAEQYCRQQLATRFHWEERQANAEKFYALLDKRFNG